MRICVNLDHVDELVHNGDVRITVAEHIINLGKVNGAVRDGHQPKTVEKQLYEMGKSKNDDCVICLDEFIEKQHIEVVVSFKNSSEGSTIPRLQTIEDLEGVDLLLHDAEMEVMNMILLSIPNEIYNSVDCLPTWPRICGKSEAINEGTIQNKVIEKHVSRNELIHFVVNQRSTLFLFTTVLLN
ncbi:hypothetical protein Tco_0785244 [Tanacetum coccineum]